MQGIPFNVTESDIAEWFSSVVDPMKVEINYSPDGRPSGNAFVLFANLPDAKKAMSKNKEHMQHRYVELFLEGEVPMNPGMMNTSGLGMPDDRGVGMGYGRGFGRGLVEAECLLGSQAWVDSDLPN